MTDSSDTPATKIPPTERRAIIISCVMGILIITLTCLLSYISVMSGKELAEKHAEENITRIAALVANQTNKTLISVKQVLLGINDALESRTHPITASADFDVHELLVRRKQNNPYLLDILILDRFGDIQEWTFTGKPPYVRDRDYAAAHLSHGHTGLFVGEPHLSRVHENVWFFGTSLAIRNSTGEITRILVAIIDIEHFQNLYLKAENNANFTIGLTTTEGIIIVREPGQKQYIGAHIDQISHFQRVGIPKHPFKVRSPLDGIERLVSVQELEDTPLIAFASFTQEDVLGNWHKDALLIGFIAAANVILVIFSFFHYSRVLHSLSVKSSKLSYLTTNDPLTNTYNRHAFMDLLRREFNRALRYGTSISCIVLDIDNLGAINEAHGYSMGDAILKKVASEIFRHSRKTDIISRSADGEFSILLPDTELHGATASAEQHRLRIEALRFGDDYTPITVTISAGVAQMHRDDSSPDALIFRTTSALKRAKDAGKNRVLKDETYLQQDDE